MSKTNTKNTPSYPSTAKKLNRARQHKRSELATELKPMLKDILRELVRKRKIQIL